MTGQKIMIIEDDLELREVIRLYLEKNDFAVMLAGNGDEAVSLASENPPDLILLDVLLPGKSGFQTCLELRTLTEAPILFLSGLKNEVDKVTGLNMGGDDYITKPFSPNELVARIKANLRRPNLSESLSEQNQTRMTFGQIHIDRLGRVVTISGIEVTLSRKEFDLLSFLASSPEQTFSHEQLFREIWGQECFNDTRTIIVHVSNLRKKIEPDPSNPRYIINVHGVGYKFAKTS